MWPFMAVVALASCAATDRPVAPGPVGPPRTETGARILDIDGATRFQVMDNFAASDCWSMQKVGLWSEENRNRVADLLFSMDKGIGLSAWRFNIGAGKCPDISPWRTAETFETAEGRYDWSRQAAERWFLAAAKARGVRQFIAFVNSPPARMTKNGKTYCTPEVGPTNLKDGHEGQYARYLADILRHFREDPDPAQRIDFGWISPVNEPQWDWNGPGQEGNRVPNDVLKSILRALDAELKRQSVPAKILAPESGSLAIPGMTGPIEMYGARYGAYVRDFCGDPEMADIMGRLVCSHSYRADLLPNGLVNARQKLRAQFDLYPGWKFWQSEYCVMQGPDGVGGGGRDMGIDAALNIARVMHQDLVLLNASAWQWWTAVSKEHFQDGLLYTDYHKIGDPETIYTSKTLWAFGNYSRFVRPGARRVALAGAEDLSGLLGSAWDDRETGRLVVVLINMGAAPETVRLRERRLQDNAAVRSWTPWVTSDQPGDDLRRDTAVAGGTDYTVPARSVVTLVGNTGA